MPQHYLSTTEGSAKFLRHPLGPLRNAPGYNQEIWCNNNNVVVMKQNNKEWATMESPSHPSKFSLCIQSKAQTSQNPQSRSNVISVVLLCLCKEFSRHFGSHSIYLFQCVDDMFAIREKKLYIKTKHYVFQRSLTYCRSLLFTFSKAFFKTFLK